MRFINRSEVKPVFEGKRVAIVGSGPGCLQNVPGFVDGHDVVVRVNNYKLTEATGFRTDVFASFFGSSIRKGREELIRDGVKLCLCKLPDSQPIDSEWHRRHRKMEGIDYRGHYRRRRASGFWFCDTYVPTDAEFLVGFNILGRRQPTSGFAAILDVLSFDPRAVYLTGFDFFQSKIHNTNETWREKNADPKDPDPIRHAPEREAAWLKDRLQTYPITIDDALARSLLQAKAA